MRRLKSPAADAWLRIALQGLIAALLACALAAVRAQGVELTTLRTQRAEGALTLDYHARLTLTPAIEDALR